MDACDRCGQRPGEIPWSGELLCWPCADHQFGQAGDDLGQPYGPPVSVGRLA